MLRLLSAFLLLAASSFAQEEGKVVTVTGGMFEQFLKDNEITMIEFYAPWCGHCKKLLPEFEAAAEDLEGDGIKLGKVDCTTDENGELCKQFDVRGYPTIKFFNKGGVAPYESGRERADIVRYIKSRSGPAVTILDDGDEAEKFSGSAEIVVLSFADEVSNDFESVANALRDDVAFGLVKGEAGSSLDGTAGDIVLFRKFDEPRVKYGGDASSEKELTDFVTAESFPLIGEIGPSNYKKYMDRGLPLVWIAIDASDEETPAIAKDHAASYKGKLSLVTIDGGQFASHIKNLGHDGDLPGVIITDGQKKFLHKSEDGKVTAESFGAFLSGWDDGTIEQFLKTEEVPEKNDESVFVLVGKNFDDEVVNNKKDVLVEFYAPWCGHCKKLEPEYDALGDLYKENDNVVIAKMDATENDGPIEIRGFPTLVFFPSEDKSNPITYSGARTTDGLDDFLKKNAINAKADAAGGEADNAEHVHEDL